MTCIKNFLKCAGALAFCMISINANAIQIYGDNGGGFSLLSTTWVTSGGTGAVATDISGGAGTDWEVLVGFDDFGDPESGTQTSGVYGGGTTISGYSSYKVVFDVQAYSWDSYNDGTTPAPGNIGLWDVFAVNMNAGLGYYWDIVTGDPIVATNPAGSVVIEDNGTSATGGLSGSTWAWGGLDYVNGTFESEIGTYTLNLTGVDINTNLFVSAVLDTNTAPDVDQVYPSWGCFNAGTGTNCPVPVVDTPEPSTMLLLGAGLLGLGFRRRRS